MAKTRTVFDEAKALAKKLAKIDQRAEAAHIKTEADHARIQQFFEDEKEAAMRGVSDAVLRCYEAAKTGNVVDIGPLQGVTRP